MLQVTPQAPALHVAVPFVGVGHAVHEVPQELGLLSATQSPLQSCLPDGHLSRHDWSMAMHAPAHSFWLAGH